MSYTLSVGSDGSATTAQVVWSVNGQTYKFRSDNNFISWITTIFDVADSLNIIGGLDLLLTDQIPPVQGGTGNVWAKYAVLGSVAGNARGVGAVDLQQFRTQPAQVASGVGSVIGGGYNNTASGYQSVVVGGSDNVSSGQGSFVGSGVQNIASASGSVAVGGRGGSASGAFSSIGGGYYNTASGNRATVGGGYSNTASGIYATVGGGYYNTASGSRATVGGGYNNTASAYNATVGGGSNNTASGDRATVGGGRNNTASGNYATVGGGRQNTASGDYATVGGGRNNTASGDYATVGGGYGNAASGDRATVGGGYTNTASAYNATVGGGRINTASGDRATVGGGYNNTASGDYATVGGGYQNTASNNYATIGGGYGALADRYGQTANASGSFGAQGDAQAVSFVMRNTTSGATTANLKLNGSTENLTIPSGKLLSGIINISGIDSTGAEVLEYTKQFAIKNVAGTTTLVHQAVIGTNHRDNPALDAVISADNVNDCLQVACTGRAGFNFRWVAVVSGLEIAYG